MCGLRRSRFPLRLLFLRFEVLLRLLRSILILVSGCSVRRSCGISLRGVPWILVGLLIFDFLILEIFNNLFFLFIVFYLYLILKFFFLNKKSVGKKLKRLITVN
jgi:hypothetical protein